MTMDSCLRIMLDGLFDYAGLFPPANLTMREAVEQYWRHCQGPEGVLVSRFVCSSTRLSELKDAIERMPEIGVIDLTIVGKPSSDYDEWQDALEHDAQALSKFLSDTGDRAAIEAYEIRIPAHDAIEKCIRDLGAFNQVDVYAELPWGLGIDDSLSQIALSEWIFAKARTGGQDASAFPSSADLAGFIHAATSLELPFKLTAGLHHPLPTLDPETGGRMHGFLNVLTTAALATSYDFTRAELAEILDDDSIASWEFGEDGLSWNGQELDEEDLEDLRDCFVSIGSCSISEPVAELSALGLYP